MVNKKSAPGGEAPQPQPEHKREKGPSYEGAHEGPPQAAGSKTRRVIGIFLLGWWSLRMQKMIGR